MKLTRREFLTLLGASAVATSVATLTRRSSPVEELERLLSEYNVAETYSVPSICGMCMAQCGIYIDVIDGAPRRIRPNTSAPTSSMGICSRGVSGLYNTLYNPDRITKPLVRKPLLDWIEGRISWDEAVAKLRELRGTDREFVEVDNWWLVAEIIAKKLKDLADNNERHALVFLYGAWGPISQLRLGVPLARFLDTYGSPNEIQFDMPACVSTRILGHVLTGVHGHQAANPMVDWWGAKTIVLIRRNNPGAGAIMTAWRLGTALSEGAKLIVLDPVFSEAASKATIWLPIKPGTDLVVILAAIRYVLENPEYMDIDYLKRYTNAPYLIVVSSEHRLSGLPIPVSEVDWGFYNLPQEYAGRSGFVVIDPTTNKPAPDDVAKDYALWGSYKIKLKDGSEVEAKTVLQLLKEWIVANLDALAKKYGSSDYIEAVAKEADVSVKDLRTAIKTIVEDKAVFEIGWHDPRYSNSPQLWRAVDILMALYGKIQRPGGLFISTHLFGAQAGLYARVKLGKANDPFYSIRGDPIASYNAKYGARLGIVPLVPPLPGPLDKGAPPIPKALTSEWVSQLSKEGYPILFPTDQVQALYDSVINGKPYKVKVVMIFASNPLVQNPNVEVWKAVFKGLELVVVHDIVMSDTALYADIITPDLTYVERLDLPLPGIYSPFPALSIRFPWYWKLYKDGKIDKDLRLFNTRTGFELLLMIAKKLDELGVKARDGSRFSDNMPVAMLNEEGKIPLQNLEKFINAIMRRVMIRDSQGNIRSLRIDDVYSAGGYVILRFTGSTVEIVDELWSKALGKEIKVRVPVFEIIRYDVSNEKRLWSLFHYQSGLGRDIPFPTPTGRIELFSVELSREVKDTLKKNPINIDPSDLEGTRSEVDPLFSPIPLYAGMARPDYMWASKLPATPTCRVDGLKEPDPSKGELLLVYRHGPFTQTHMNTQNNILLNKITVDTLFMAWIHPETAARLGIRDGDWIIVEPATPKVIKQIEAVGGKIPKMKIKVRVTKMVRKDILYILHGWPTESKLLRNRLERIKEFRDVSYGVTDDNYFIPIVATQLGGGYAMGTAIVKISKAG
ncbi:MAG: molybdopterin-containing oxidoreductase family protein [Sulfolobales archaeon]